MKQGRYLQDRGGSAMSPFEVHPNLQRQIVPKTQVGVKIGVIGAALLIFFAPGQGVLHGRVLPQLCWVLSILGIVMMVCGGLVVIYLPAHYRRMSRLLK